MKLVSLATCFMIASNAFAVDRTVSDLRIPLNEWELVPTMIGSQVESFVGLRDSSAVIGSNVTAVWFLRDSDTTWHVLAWQDQDKIKSIAHVKSSLGLADSTDSSWPDAGAQQGVDPLIAEQPEEFSTGVFDDDPFLEVIDSLPEPGAFLDTLTSAGWSSANIAIQTGESSCTQDEVLTTLAAMVETDIAIGAGGSIVEGFSLPLPNCNEWMSITRSLSASGTWAVEDYLAYIEENSSISSGSAWQSIDADTVFTGAQTVVIDAGGNDEEGQQFTSTHLAVTLTDRTPPTFEVVLLGNDNEPLVSAGGLKYFQLPVLVTVNVAATDNVDGQLSNSPEPKIEIYIDGEVFSDVREFTEPGYHSLKVKVSDSGGNSTTHSQLFEVREDLNLEMITAIESISVSQAGDEDLAEVTILLMSGQIDPCQVNLATLSLWLYDGANQPLLTQPLQVSQDYIVDGEYNSVTANIDEGVWRIVIQGYVPAGTMSIQGLKYIVTGSGAFGEPGAFDFLSLWSQFVIEPNAYATLRAQVVHTDCDCETKPSPPCVWKSQFLPDPVDTDEVSVQETTRREHARLTANPTDFTGFASVEHRMGATCRVNESVVSGGTFKVFLAPQHCCLNCTISVVSRPRVTLRGGIHGCGTKTAVACGLVSVATPCGDTQAAGGVAIGESLGTTVSVTLGPVQVNLPVGSEDEDEKVFIGNLSCVQQACSIDVSIVTAMYLSMSARKNLLFPCWAEAWGGGEGSLILTVTPTSLPGCDIMNNGEEFTIVIDTVVIDH